MSNANTSKTSPLCVNAYLCRDLVETSQDLIWQCNAEGRYTYLNRTWEEIFGYCIDEMLGKKFIEFLRPDVAERDGVEFDRLMSGNAVQEFETVHVGKAGQEIYLIFYPRYMKNPNGNIIGARGIARHVNKRDKAFTKLGERDVIHAALFSDSPLLMAVSRVKDNLIVDVNQTFLQSTGHSREDVIGKKAQHFGLLHDPQERLRAIIEQQKSGSMNGFEMLLKQKDGTPLPVLASSKIVEIEIEKCVLTSGIDISNNRRKTAESNFIRSEFLIRTAIENLPIIFFILDSNGIFQLSIGSGLAVPGLEQNQVIGQSAFEIYKDYPNIVAALEQSLSGARASFEAEVNGEFYFSVCVPVTGWFDGSVSVVFNITERKRNENAIQKVQIMESLGTLAAGIAHDFNNLLGGMFGYVDLARLTSKEPENERYFTSILQCMDRARRLTHQLLTFAKGGAPVRQLQSIHSCIRDVVCFLPNDSSVSVQFQLPDDLWFCDVDKVQICQVMENIVINAQQAMPSGGNIDITATNITLAKNEHPLLKAGNYVRITITDTGIGIPEDILDRIFDPFFSTKSTGHGLGLATSFSIMKRHDGALEVTSKPGSGSTFTLYLHAIKSICSELKTLVLPNTGSGTIVVADDETMMRTMIGEMLKTLGYTVILEADCGDAVTTFLNIPQADRKIVALIFDLTIPGGIGGLAATAALRKHNSEIPIFAISGYSDDPIMMNPNKYGFSGSIAKPFSRKELSKVLSEVLGTRKSPASTDSP